MGESLQAVLALLMIIGMFGSVLVYMSDRVNAMALLGMLTLTFGSLGLLIWSILRHDKVPDFLNKVPGPLVERDGFCFKLQFRVVKGRFYLVLHFQSRYERRSRATVLLRPSRGFFLVRNSLASMNVEIECPAGAYGMTSVALPVAKKLHDKTQSLDIGADVLYPEGKGKMIRYRGGRQVPTASKLIVLSNPPKVRVKLRLPVQVEESIDDDLPNSTTIMWELEETPDTAVSKKKPVADPDF